MRNYLCPFLAVSAMLMAGCAGPEEKIGRGMRNVGEIIRMGEMRRSIEQTALWESPNRAFTTGAARGFNRSMARTFVGVYEIVTAPFPPFDPVLAPKNKLYPDASIRATSYPYGGMVLEEDPVYPDSYKPGLFSSSIFDTDTQLGFSSGDVAPMIPGSRFRIFDH